MSGYHDGSRSNRREYRRDYDRDRRDPRERSPSRSNAYPSDQYGRNRSNDYMGDQTRNIRSENARSSFNVPNMTVSGSKLPDLPTSVAVPENGNELPASSFRPKARDGRRISVLTNHFKIQSLPIVKVHEYELRFAVPPDSQRRSMQEVTQQQREKAIEVAAEYFGSSFVFDGVSLGWSVDNLLSDSDQSGMRRVNLPGHRDERPNQMDITIRRTGKVDIRSLVQHIQGQPRNVLKQMVWLNAVFRDEPSRRFITRPRGLQYFIREPGLFQTLQSTGGILEALRGFHQSVSSHFGMLTVNVDTAVSPFYAPDLPLLQLMMTFAGAPPGSSPEELFRKEGVFDDVSERISSIYFYVIHAGDNRQSRKIKAKGLYKRSAREAVFEQLDRATGDTALISVLDYMRRRYSVELQHPDLPLIESNQGLFPAEICRTTSGERYKEVLEGKDAADFIKFATAPAFTRKSQVMEGVRRLAWHQKESKLARFGLSVSTQMLEVQAVHLQPSVPQYGRASQTTRVVNGSWNLANKSFIEPKSFSSWGFIYFLPSGRIPPVHERELEAFMRTIHDELRKYGINPPNATPVMMFGNPEAEIRQVLRNLIGKTGERFQHKPDILFALLHDGMSSMLYKAIKNATEVDYGVPMQIMKVEKSVRGRGRKDQYCANIAMKVNVKLGGTNSVVRERILESRAWQFIGADVSHPSAAQLRSTCPPPSIAALSGTYDSNCVKYTAVAAAQPTTQEIITNGGMPIAFAAMVQELIQRYTRSNNGRLPESVIYWRDGISESQESSLMSGEVQILKDKLGPINIKLTVINCIKRHHTRFFPKHPNDGDEKLGNVLPGTVVESGPSSAFVLAHGALQGTVRPTHYRILFDENELSIDELNRLVLAGCFSYSRSTRSVHIHPAVYYADQIAERSTARLRVVDGCTVFADVHDDIKMTMWWQ